MAGSSNAHFPMNMEPGRLQAALAGARNALLAERNRAGHWTGQLSSSALSTATAVAALQIVQRERGGNAFQSLIDGGLKWLAQHQNPDGGWGDTVLSFSNISTTTLCWAAFGVVPGVDDRFKETVEKAREWLRQHAGGLEVDALADAIIQRYGKDRTFSVPILTMCALSGRLGAGADAWRRVIPLPFELAAFPQTWFAALRLPVVSYALPALIAIGQARHRHAPTGNPIARAVRNSVADRTLSVLERIQPTSGGFLEATPLTSFVCMSLAGSGLADHAVTTRGVDFLVKSVLPDGSWAIDTNLATWVTTLSVNALANDPAFQLPKEERHVLREWLLGQQYRTVHPYTNAAPGGWAWTDLPGGVPDADDTAGSLLALKLLGDVTNDVRTAAMQGVRWLLDLQNGDGGIPTFCRGWTNLPFDRSSPDITAHAMRAWLAWIDDCDATLQTELRAAILRAYGYLLKCGTEKDALFPSWLWQPLWFGNQHCPDDSNVTYGTAKVLKAMTTLESHCRTRHVTDAWFARESFGPLKERILPAQACLGAASRLLTLQQSDGSWGGGANSPGSIEETALALEALAGCWNPYGKEALKNSRELGRSKADASLAGLTSHLVSRVESGTWTQPAPIGFYFARLWYYEKLYPMIFTVGALGKAAATS